MVINQTFELSMILDADLFQKVFSTKVSYLKELNDEYLDTSLAAKGITVIYRDSRYKKKVRILINTALIVNDPSDCSISWTSTSLNTSIIGTRWMILPCLV